MDAIRLADCDRCRKVLARGIGFAFKTSAGETIRCLGCALQFVPVLRRSALASLVVGSVLVALNQGDLIFSGDWTNTLYLQVPLTYTIPFLVVTWGALSNSRVQRNR